MAEHRQPLIHSEHTEHSQEPQFVLTERENVYPYNPNNRYAPTLTEQRPETASKIPAQEVGEVANQESRQVSEVSRSPESNEKKGDFFFVEIIKLQGMIGQGARASALTGEALPPEWFKCIALSDRYAELADSIN